MTEYSTNIMLLFMNICSLPPSLPPLPVLLLSLPTPQQTFKHNDENVNWMVSNQLAGFTQRTDGVRKWAMGSFVAMDTLAAKGCYDVEGVWCFRGTDMEEMKLQNPEAELYNWVKVDVTDPAQKQRVNDFWTGEGHNGVRWYQWASFY